MSDRRPAGSVTGRGITHQEAPQAHAQKEAQEDAEKDAPPAQQVALVVSAQLCAVCRNRVGDHPTGPWESA